jgi:hypothetical protein
MNSTLAINIFLSFIDMKTEDKEQQFNILNVNSIART